MLNLSTVGCICLPAVTPVPIAPAEWKVAASGDSERQVRTASYEANVDFSFADIFTGEVRQVLSVLFKMRKKWNRSLVDQHIGNDISLLYYVTLFIIQTAFCDSSSSYLALQLLYIVLAFSTNSFHLLLSWARVFQFGTFFFCISFLTSSLSVSLVFLLAFLKGISRSKLPLPFSYLASFQCDRASSVFVLG